MSMIGEVKEVAFANAPLGWLSCDGQELDRDVYADLFNAIGIEWGEGNGSTTFNIPDLRGRTTIHRGQGDDLTDREFADQIGEEFHLLTGNESGIASHTHDSSSVTVNTGGFSMSIYDNGHDHGGIAPPYPAGTAQSGNDISVPSQTAGTTATGQAAIIANFSGQITLNGNVSTVADTNALSPHNNVQPSSVMNKIIFTGLFI